MKVGLGSRVDKIVVATPRFIRLGSECNIEDGVVFNNHGAPNAPAVINIGDKCFIGRDTIFNSYYGVYIGDHSMVAARCQFLDSDHGFETRSEPIGKQPAQGGAIRLERDVWIGAGVIILKSVTIGEGAIVGAGSVVTKNIPAWEIWAGNPAKKIGLRP